MTTIITDRDIATIRAALDARRHEGAFVARMRQDGLGAWPWHVEVDEAGLIRVLPSDLERAGGWVLGRTVEGALQVVRTR